MSLKKFKMPNLKDKIEEEAERALEKVEVSEMREKKIINKSAKKH